MQLPRPRLRLRTLLIAVAVVAVAIVAGQHMWRRRAICLEYAARHAKAERDVRRLVGAFRNPNWKLPANSDPELHARKVKVLIAEAERRKRARLAYERVARFPWLPVPQERDFDLVVD
jgi:hypothetical protein